jgi:hypothetical protein
MKLRYTSRASNDLVIAFEWYEKKDSVAAWALNFLIAWRPQLIQSSRCRNCMQSIMITFVVSW